MNAIRKLRATLVLAIIVGWVGNAWAENWTGSIGNKTYSTNTTVNVTGNTTLTGAVKVTGGTLTINASGANRTISRGSSNTNALFTVSSGARLVINGGTYKITIDGISKANCGSAIVVNVGGTAVLTDVTIQNNFRKKSSRPKTSEHTDGGAIYTRGTLTCTNCNFINNRADFGGAICVYNRGNATITGGSIIRNTGYWRGGGVAVGNTATFLGPAFDTSLSGNATVTLSGVTIGGSSANKNTASELFGGGLYVAYTRGKAIITNNTDISYNQSQYGGHGVCVSDMGEADLGDCAIHHNSPCGNKTYDYGGGGLYIGGTIDDGATATIKAGCKIYQNTAARGAGVNMQANMELKMQGGEIYENYTYYSSNNVAINTTTGGGVYLGGDASSNKGKFTMTGGVIRNNTTANNGDGGGVYIAAGTVNISGGQIYGNMAAGRGGGIFNNLGSLTMSGGSVYSNEAKTGSADGGGFYLTNGNATISGTAAIYSNKGNNGGGVFLNRGTFTMNGGEIYGNTATNQGGGIYLTANCTFNMTGGNIGKAGAAKNTAKQGGGVYDLGKFTMSNGTISNNEATAGDGGGAYVSTNQVTSLSNGSVNDNTASGNGGGINIIGGSSVTVSSVSIFGNTASSGSGGGLYVGNGDITLSGAKVSGNSADNGKGGGIYAGNGNIQVKDGAEIGTYSAKAGSGNSASEGGGLYVNGGTVVFTNGTFADNYASEKGGGIYIKEGAALNLRETAEITGNHVPATGQGGGVYMDGTLNVGENADDPADKHAIIVRDNYAGSAFSLATRNNVFLPSTTRYITLLSDIHSSDSKVGFSVTQGFCPVIYTDIEGSNASHEQWLYDLLGGTSGLRGAIFDDAQKYFALHVRTDQGPFEAKYDYLWGAWTTHVNHNPNDHLDEYPLPTGVSTHFTEESDGWHIYTKEGLAWFISYVNDLNGAGEHRSANAFLENDVDMSGHLWVPIGGTTSFNSEQGIFAPGGYYEGHFDGKGHIISNLDCRYLNAVLKIGLFGTVTGGSITNTFVDGYEFTTQFDDKEYCVGGIAGLATGGVISNCEARGLMETDYCVGSASYMGGLVGKLEGATVHSSMAMPTMGGIAQHMGGLVGYVASGYTLKNSFSNAEITRGTTTSQIGGLVGTNSGTVENCYVRLRGSEPTGFGWFAGNNEGSIQYCYAPTGKTNYVNSTSGTPALAGHGNYGATALVDGKYGYAHQDQDVALAVSTDENDYIENGPIGNDGELKGLLATLNNWVEAQTDGVAYSTWTRTMASPINDDLPILEFDDFVSAGSTDNVFIAYKADLNDMIDYANANSTGGSVYLYDATPTAVSESTKGNVRVYIDPNVGITQATGNTLNARVGITLDNSSTEFMAYDWHMFSSALATAPMGIVYPTSLAGYHVYDNYSTYKADGIPDAIYNSPHPNYMEAPATTWNTTSGHIGYFPTNTAFGYFDFYCYEEGVRHWINFKRQGHSGFYDHWHQDVDENGMHQNIGYTNEADMEVGKGYMLAITAPSMLMTDGVLNNGDKSRNASFTAGGTYDYPLRGINLVGNPYQSYLDFNAFANENGFDTYYILDADKRGYIAYTAGATPQVDAPSRYIHPHQGFFVRVTETQDIEFNNEMRVAGPNSSFESDYRDWEPRYALVNMVCTDGEGRNDFATIELDRPEQGGGRKAKGLRSGDASIWFRLGDEDYQIAFAPVGTQSAALRFEAHTDGVYTLRWNMQNADFSYLHLIDNLTGADIDCLMADEYRFEATTHDYTSRFRLVFDFTGVEENDDPTEGPSSFAFMMGDELVINGEGMLQMFDLNGRQLFSTEIHGTQATVAMPKVADGLYVLHLTNGNQVRTQKMVINK